ncbi:hypothetical protein L484_003115 [Morus notabilis]|uniref:Neprosin PEP catalytic domain-containing protein n=1 Tax=Morus notabilis TaxID=981085 RepID=W9RT31_9ROSA|nr:hypothetical protein L484_003115 [Morus notabilis]
MGFENHKTVFRSCGILALITLYHLNPVEFAYGRNIASGRHDLELVKHKGTFKSIESKNGEVIDCVDIYKQPAFDHPLLKNHTIEMHPSSNQNVVESENDQITPYLQEWHENGECPEGTIPIVRTLKSVYPRKAILNISIDRIGHHQFGAPTGHEYAQVTFNGGKYYGVQANINVWTPTTYSSEYSLAQLWVLSGEGENLNSVEAGWMRDGYQNSGCYNLDCPGFVQVNRRFALDYKINRVSTYNGPQFNIPITIFKNKVSGHWWLQILNTSIGYWPDSIFTTLRDGSNTINCGGEIINNEAGGRHTQTDMGSGHFPIEGFKRASYFSNIKYMDGNGEFKDPEQLIPYATKPSCYDLHVGEDKSTSSGTYFYFGGPGYSDICQN